MKPLSLMFLATLAACAAPAESETARLLFASGFEGDVRFGVREVEESYYQPIIGTDSETGFSWPITVLGATRSALHIIDHGNFTALENALQTVIGHNGRQARALYSAQSHDLGATQSPYEILNIRNGRHDLYIRYWMKLDAASLHGRDTWRALFEYKTGGYATGDGFRLISYVYTDASGQPYWRWQGDANPGHQWIDDIEIWSGLPDRYFGNEG